MTDTAANPVNISLNKKLDAHNRNHEENVHTEMLKRSDNSCNPCDIGEELIVTEILSRLEVKPLTRLKCVCKRWQFLIEQDQYFIQLHHTRSKTRPRLLITGTSSINQDKERELFLVADFLVEGKDREVSSIAVSSTVRDEEKFIWDSNRTLGPVNSVIGLIDCTSSEMHSGVRMWNASTHEVTRSVSSALPPSILCRPKRLAKIELGFSPATMEHKAICIWHRSYTDDRIPLYSDAVCEVLTAGDNKWRKIDGIPQHCIGNYAASVHVNGVIYFTTEMFAPRDIKFIVAFDVDTEKFRPIEVPSCILNPRQYSRDIGLQEVDGRVALIIRMSCNSVKLALLDDYYGKVSTSNHNWTEVKVDLPSYLSGGLRPLRFLHVLGTDDIILHRLLGNDDIVTTIYDEDYQWNGDEPNVAYLDCFNWKNKSFRKIKISGIIPLDSFEPSSVKLFVESLLPVKRRSKTRP